MIKKKETSSRSHTSVDVTAEVLLNPKSQVPDMSQVFTNLKFNYLPLIIKNNKTVVPTPGIQPLELAHEYCFYLIYLRF